MSKAEKRNTVRYCDHHIVILDDIDLLVQPSNARLSSHSTQRGLQNVATTIHLQYVGHDELIPLWVHVNTIQRPRLAFSRHADEVEEAVSRRGLINKFVS